MKGVEVQGVNSLVTVSACDTSPVAEMDRIVP